MSKALSICAGFRCPNCKTWQDYWRVRRLLWVNRIWPLFVKSYGTGRPVYKAPLYDAIQCDSCQMDLHLRKGSTVKAEVACWAVAIAAFAALMGWLLQLPAFARPPSLLELSPEQQMERLRETARGNGGSSGLVVGIFATAAVCAPICYVAGRFASYRVIRLSHRPPSGPLQPTIFEE